MSCVASKANLLSLPASALASICASNISAALSRTSPFLLLSAFLLSNLSASLAVWNCLNTGDPALPIAPARLPPGCASKFKPKFINALDIDPGIPAFAL